MPASRMSEISVGACAATYARMSSCSTRTSSSPRAAYEPDPGDLSMTEKSVDRLYQIVQRTLGVAVEALSGRIVADDARRVGFIEPSQSRNGLEEEFGVHLSSQDVVNMRSLTLIRKGLRDRGVKI